ncbi:ORF6N domain-containing protein [Ligilactobacillus ruminis]|uniref:Toxin-antitoxin system, toxin component, Bro family n=1 Tax=Ligilactobacillus ruminis ATCC 25644 TaxID=525362 RepID=E7FPC3_9LACO|nr:ORF6N domain-containing protein [Ligilactobacillus ruminis]EFZ35165.1 toxin-antitoxin system, toxin component, Bro family [Ligilactobacillus ruminis ATCC 25644]EGX97944.1 prophage pi2 protein 06 [Ligilactobacillus ruminis ATCC 25644]UWP41064.1 ORF6N domain-containing protein [Ligilactobacillus ruminis]
MELKVLGQEKIGQYEFTGIEGGFGENKRAMLVKDIAAIHGSTVKRINELINRNRPRFLTGIDILDLKIEKSMVVLNDLKFSKIEVNNANNIYMLSERGYAKLLKILEDDTAWDIYDELVDNYFNMRQAIKADNKALVANKRLAIMEENAKTRKANLLYKIAMATESQSSAQSMLALAAKELTGEMTIPVMKRKEYSATEVGEKLGISAQKVGKIANQLGIKAEQPGQNRFGRWANSKSRYSDKEVAQWLYYQAGVNKIAEFLREG